MTDLETHPLPATGVFTAGGPLARGLVSGSRELLQRTSLPGGRWWAARPDQRLLAQYLVDGAEARGPLAFANGELLAAGDRGWLLGGCSALGRAYFCSISPWRYSGEFEGGPAFRQCRYFGSQFGSQPSAVRTVSTVPAI